MSDLRNTTVYRFDEPTINALGGGGGVYALAARRPATPDSYTVLYVGKAANLKERLRCHFEIPPVPGISHFFAERIDDEQARAKREQERIMEFIPVGNALESLPRPALTEAAYLAARILWHRSLLAPGEPDRSLAKDYGRDVPASIKSAADQLLKAIEAAEGKSIESLDRDTTRRYLNLLSDAVRDRSKADVGYDPNQGQHLLLKLRHGDATGWV